MFSNRVVLSLWLLVAGFLCLAQAQVPMTGAGLGKTASVATTAFDPAKTGADLALTNSNLTVTKSNSGFNNALAVGSASTALVYFELHLDIADATFSEIGFAPSSISHTTFIGNTGGFGVDQTGAARINGGAGPTIGSWGLNDTVSLALDTTHSKVWVRVNANGWNNDILANQNPANNTGGINIAALTGPFFAGAALFTALSKWTANFGATAYAQTPPSGYSNW